MPWTTEPQYSVQRRPILSRVKTQIRVAIWEWLVSGSDISDARGAYHVCDGVQSGNPLHLRVGNTSGTEDGRGEDGHTGDTDPLLHNLEPDDELDATAGVKLAGANAEEHGKVRLGLGGLTFELGDVADVLEFSLGLADIFTSLTTKSSEDVTGLFFAADLDEPTG